MEQHLLNNRKSIKDAIEKTEPDEDIFISKHDSSSSNFCTRQPFRSNAYVLIIIIKGKINLTTNFSPETFKEKDLAFLFPGAIYEVSELTDASFIRIVFKKNYLKNQGIFLSNAESYRLFQSNSSHKFSLTKEEYTDILHNAQKLQKRLKLPADTPLLNEVIRNSFLEVLYDLFLINNKRRNFSPIKHDRKAELTSRFLNLLADHFKNEKKVQYYASALYITPRHLSQVVKQVTGKTAGELIDEMVIREAKVLLTGHILNVSEVAELLSFSNSSFFGKYFKKYTGTSPSAYRLAHNIARTSSF